MKEFLVSIPIHHPTKALGGQLNVISSEISLVISLEISHELHVKF